VNEKADFFTSRSHRRHQHRADASNREELMRVV